MSRPVLYSFRRCPYAMRARMAIAYSGLQVELREVILKDKPDLLLLASPKATVPVLVLKNGHVIDESLDIMQWALNQHDPDHWQEQSSIYNDKSKHLITENDTTFKTQLDQYKYADRFPENSAEHYRNQGEAYLTNLEKQLTRHKYLLRDEPDLADIAIFPFIRQFAHVDKTWFDQAPYPELQAWLKSFIDSKLFSQVMKKYPPWTPGQTKTIF